MKIAKLSAKEYLRQLRRLDVEIKAKLDECEWVRNMATRTGANLSSDRVSGGRRATSKIEDYVVKLVTLEEALHRDVANLAKLKKEVMAKINSLEVSDYRTLLTMRYVKGLTWEEIAVNMSFSYRHTLRIHGAALTEFEIIYKGA